MYKLVFVAGLLLASCTAPKTSESTTSLPTTDSTATLIAPTAEKADDHHAEAAKQWLTKTIISYFSAPELSSLNDMMKKNTTSDYYAYKMDATNVDLDVDGSLTVEAFHKKWKDKFDTDKAGIGTGFLITGQDWSKIIVEKCTLISAKDHAFLFDVVLKDVDFDARYPSQILVTLTNGVYQIADVKE